MHEAWSAHEHKEDEEENEIRRDKQGSQSIAICTEVEVEEFEIKSIAVPVIMKVRSGLCPRCVQVGHLFMFFFFFLPLFDFPCEPRADCKLWLNIFCLKACNF